VGPDDAREFVTSNHRAVLITRRSGGGLQASPVLIGVDGQGKLVISTREGAYKTRNLRRDPSAVLCVFSDGFFGRWMQIEGTAQDRVAAGGDGRAGRLLPPHQRGASGLGRLPLRHGAATACAGSRLDRHGRSHPRRLACPCVGVCHHAAPGVFGVRASDGNLVVGARPPKQEPGYQRPLAQDR
jgi:PPOX class probable F420-dependent enzyme